MTLTGIILIIAIGLIFMLIEVLVIPGVGVVGVIGGGLMAVGVYYAYQINSTTGHITLLFSAGVSVGLLVLALRSKTWDRLMLKKEIKSKVNVLEDDLVKPGDSGITVSRLAPMGKARINNELVEVKSFNSFIDENTEVEVLKVEGNSIIVKLKSE